jgi:3-hydroxyethyl bacteriochlorophyllide a dehydrogenase
VVVAAGGGVTSVRVGDEVFVGGSKSFSDVAAAFGGQASRLIKRAEDVVPLHGIPLRHGPLLALAATALHGVRRLGDLRGRRIAIFGLSPLGALAARFLDAAGAELAVIDADRDRLDAVKAWARRPVTTARRAGDSPALENSADVVVEATGDSGRLADCARVLRRGGFILLLSQYEQLATPFAELFFKEATLAVSREWTASDLLAARDAIASGIVEVASLAYAVMPIRHYAAAYETAFNDPSSLKVVLDWS